MSRQYKGSIQKKEDLLWYQKNKKDFDKALRRIYVSKVLDFTEVYSRTGQIKELFIIRGVSPWFPAGIKYSIKKRIKKAKPRFVCTIKGWGDENFEDGFDTIEEAKNYIRNRIVRDEARNLNRNIVENRPLFRQIFNDVIIDKE